MVSQLWRNWVFLHLKDIERSKTVFIRQIYLYINKSSKGFSVFIIPLICLSFHLNPVLLEPSADLSLPQVLIRFWKPLLGYLHHHNMTPDLISAFLGALSGTGDLSDRIVIGWIFTIVDKLQNIGMSAGNYW